MCLTAWLWPTALLTEAKWVFLYWCLCVVFSHLIPLPSLLLSLSLTCLSIGSFIFPTCCCRTCCFTSFHFLLVCNTRLSWMAILPCLLFPTCLLLTSQTNLIFPDQLVKLRLFLITLLFLLRAPQQIYSLQWVTWMETLIGLNQVLLKLLFPLLQLRQSILVNRWIPIKIAMGI